MSPAEYAGDTDRSGSIYAQISRVCISGENRDTTELINSDIL